MPVRLTIEHGPHPGLARAEILRRARAMVRLLQLEKQELSLVLTDDEQIQKLNRIYRRKDRPTDVLAFAQREGELASHAGLLLGDVVVSVPTARKQAARAARALVDEVTMLVAHGLLHLLGWDHDTPAEDRRMRAETHRLCAAAAPPSPLRRGRARAAQRTHPGRGNARKGTRRGL
jgi:probable rRNA maturation factor